MTRPGRIVLDVSVMLKWRLLDEENVEQALSLRGDCIEGRALLTLPTLAPYEISNGLVMASRRRRLVGLGVVESLEAFFDVGLELKQPDW